jgi:arsenate reductase (glutaredoxin)
MVYQSAASKMNKGSIKSSAHSHPNGLFLLFLSLFFPIFKPLKTFIMLKIFHNPKCRKSREGLEMLKSKTSDFEIIDYIKKGLTENDLKEILLKSNIEPHQIVRTQEDLYKKELKGKNFTREEWIKIICENPQLLQRPFVVGKTKAILLDAIDKIEQVIK